MHFIVIKDEYKKNYYVVKTPYLPEFYSMMKQKNSSRYKFKIFSDKYSERVLKLLYIRYLIACKYRYRRKVIAEFLSSLD